MASEEVHYVARVVVEKVVKSVDPQRNYDKVPGDRDKVERTVIELATFTAKDSDLSNLKSKVMAHTDLVSEF